jgi:hypothetical protein
MSTISDLTGQEDTDMQITRSSIDTQTGAADWFTGDVDVDVDAVAAPEATST